MGCQQSSLIKQTALPLAIADPTLLNSHSPHHALLLKHNIHPKAYVTLHCLLQSLTETYAHHIVVRETDLQGLKEGLTRLKMDPKIFVLGKKQGKEYGRRVTYFQKYEELPSLLHQQERTQQTPGKTQGKNVLLRILKDFKGDTASQLLIFEETLKAKGITYQLYTNFSQLEHSKTTSPLLVVDYRFHKATIALNPTSKVICLCSMSAEENYDPQLFFFTNNFQQVVAQALVFKGLTHPVLPISKAFLCSSSTKLLQYGAVFQIFALKVKAFHTIEELIRVTRLYFSVMVICAEDEAEAIQRKIKQEGCGWRIRVIKIPTGTEPSLFALRSTLKEIKRGYLVARGPAQVVDIIDKYHSSTKFAYIKKELANNGIAFKCYSNVQSYCKTLTFIAPVVICNFDDRLLLHKFLGEARSHAKVIIFCNKNKIDEQLSRDKRWSFVSSHFGKIMKHIRGHHALLPFLAGSAGKKAQVKGNQSGKEHRLSAAQWAQQQPQNQHASTQNQQFAIGNIKQYTSKAIEFLKLSYNPLSSLQQFRKNLLKALTTLISKCRINILDGDLTKLSKEFSHANIRDLLLRSRRFLGEEKEVGIGINNILKSIDAAGGQTIREAVFLLCLNFLGEYELPLSHSLRLSCWTQEQAIKECQKGSVITCRNFLVMREDETFQQLPGCMKVELDLEYSPVRAERPQMGPFFAFDGRYVLAPFSQLKVAAVDIEQEHRVVKVTLIQENHFLADYFLTIFGDITSKVFGQQLKKGDNALAQVEHLPNILTNLTRLENYSLSKDPQTLPKAIASQRQMIHQQEQSENFDSRLLTELKFQLAVFLSLSQEEKEGNEGELLDLIGEIKQGSPSSYVKRECVEILGRLKGTLQHGKERAKTGKCVELQQQIERDSQEDSSEGLPLNDPTAPHYENIFQCLQLDENEGLTEQFA